MGGVSVEIIFIPIIIALIVVIILSIIFKGTSKVDKGFEFNYFKLSYRRKLIRTLTTLPIIILGVVIIYVYTNWNILANLLVGVLLLVFYLVQLTYNFYMWKRNET